MRLRRYTFFLLLTLSVRVHRGVYRPGPRLLERIRDLIPDPDRAHMVPFMATWDDRELAVRLGIPVRRRRPEFYSPPAD